MNTYEVRAPDGTPLMGITTDRAVQAKRNLSRGVVTVWATSDPALGYNAMGYDPTMPGPLVLVTSDATGAEIDRQPIPETGAAPEGWTTKRGVVPPRRDEDVTPKVQPLPPVTPGTPNNPNPAVRPNG